MWTEVDEYLDNENNNRKEEEKKLRSKLIDLYENSNEEIKLLISMLIHTEYSLAIERDNYINRETTIKAQKENITPVYDKANNLKKYKNDNEELINRVW